MKLDDRVSTTTRKRYRLMARLRDKLSFESNPQPEAAIDAVAHDKPLDVGQEDANQEDARPDVETESREEESSPEK